MRKIRYRKPLPKLRAKVFKDELLMRYGELGLTESYVQRWDFLSHYVKSPTFMKGCNNGECDVQVVQDDGFALGE